MIALFFLYKYLSLSRFVRNAFFLNLSRRRILRSNSELNQGLSFGLIITFFPRNAFFTEGKKDVGEFFTCTVN